MKRAAICLVMSAVVSGLAAPALASFPATDVYLPSVGRGAGASGSQWSTAIWLHNPGVSTANVQVFFLKRDQPNPAPQVFNLAVPAGDTIFAQDAMTTMFGGGFGALRLVSDQLLLVGSRIYSQPAGGEPADSVGQYFAAVPAGFAIAAGQSTQILGVYQTAPAESSEFRYNFGFVETTGSGAAVRVTACDATGAVVGTKDYALGGREVRQYSITDLLPGVDSQNLRLSAAVVSGAGRVVVFGSQIANASNDPSTFEMSFSESLLGGGGTVVHDATLAGDGTAAAPLAVADGGVTPAKLAATGSTSGQVLTSSGASVSWKNPGGFTLPYSGSVASVEPGFSITNSSGTVAVRGLATSTGQEINYGGYFEAYGPSGRGVAGAVNGGNAWGVFGYAAGAGKGVYGRSSGGDGVAGESATAAKSGVYGFNTASGGYGVFGRNTATASVGYLGGTNGVWGVASGTGLNGGYFESSGSLAAGVYGKSTATNGYGGVFEATGGNSYGLLAVGPPAGVAGAAAIFRGNVQIRSRSTEAVLVELGEGLDYAEGFPTADDSRIAPGSVLVIAADGSGSLMLTDQSYDRRVAGVVAGGEGLGSGIRLAPGRFDHDVALAGRVYCNVDAGYGEVRPGDLLTTSPTPGFAMVAADRKRLAGAVLGKAMEGIAEGRRGRILVLVALQ